MASNDVLREFLISLGFKVDKQGQEKFVKSVTQVTKGVMTLGAAAAAASVAVGAAVTKIAGNLDTLYFASQRNKASVKNIEALKFAAKQLGASADGAMGSLESLSRFMRESPAAKDWLNRLGVATQENGQDRDRAEILLDVAQKLKEMPEAQSYAYGKFLGIDDNFIEAIRRGDIQDFIKEYKSLVGNTDLDKAAKEAAKYIKELDKLKESFKILGYEVTSQVLQKINPALQDFKKWFDDNKPQIIGAITDISSILLRFCTEVVPLLVGAVDIFVKLDKATDGWSTRILALAAAFRVLGGTSAFSLLMKLAKAGGAVGAAASRMLGGAALLFHSEDLNKGEKEFLDKQRAMEQDATIPKTPEDVKKTSNEIIDHFTGLGWSKEQAAGIAANLYAESGFNHKVEGDYNKKTGKYDAYGLAQWHGDRQAEFKKKYNKDIRDASRAEQLDFIHYELTQGNEQDAGRRLRQAQSAGDSAQILTKYYERPADTVGEMRKRSGVAVGFHKNSVDQATQLAANVRENMANANSATVNNPFPQATSNNYNNGREVVVNQTTNINVEGSGANANDLASRILNGQSDVTRNLARNLKGAVA